MNSSSLIRTLVLAVAATLFAAGCADRLRREGDTLIAQGQYEEGLAKLREAEQADGRFGITKPEWTNRRLEVVGRLLREADGARLARQFEGAEGLLERAAKISPADERIPRMRDAIRRDRRLEGLLARAKAFLKGGETEQAQTLLKQVLAENPEQAEARELDRGIDDLKARELFSVPSLRGLYKKPMSLEFRDAPLKMVFEVLSRTTGINFILDKDVRSDQRTTLFL
jgi:general secretion pathway protein D